MVAAHTSSIIEALRSGAGSGRLSTLEAMALLVLEAEACASPEPKTATMDSAAGDASSAGGLGVALSGLASVKQHSILKQRRVWSGTPAAAHSARQRAEA